MKGIRREFRAVRVPVSEHVPRKLNDRHLHPQADAEEGNFLCSGVPRGLDHALGSALSESARDQDTVDAVQILRRELVRTLFPAAFLLQVLRIDPAYFYIDTMCDSPVLQRFDDRKLSVVKLRVFSDNRDLDVAF